MLIANKCRNKVRVYTINIKENNMSMICNVCNYEVASQLNDYPPDCGGSGDSKCNECIQCLLYCDCKGE